MSRSGGRLCPRVLNYRLLSSAPTTRCFRSALCWKSTSHTGTCVKAGYATLHSCKCTSGKPVIAQWCCYSSSIFNRTFLQPTFSIRCILSNPEWNYVGCCSKNRLLFKIFPDYVIALLLSSVLFFICDGNVPRSPPLLFLLHNIMWFIFQHMWQ